MTSASMRRETRSDGVADVNHVDGCSDRRAHDSQAYLPLKTIVKRKCKSRMGYQADSERTRTPNVQEVDLEARRNLR